MNIQTLRICSNPKSKNHYIQWLVNSNWVSNFRDYTLLPQLERFLLKKAIYQVKADSERTSIIRKLYRDGVLIMGSIFIGHHSSLLALFIGQKNIHIIRGLHTIFWNSLKSSCFGLFLSMFLKLINALYFTFSFTAFSTYYRPNISFFGHYSKPSKISNLPFSSKYS